jgi:REP element-mobilizing transposase RayT
MILTPPHGKALRLGRHSEAGSIYLITTCCQNRRRLFVDLSLGHVVIDEMLRSRESGSAQTLSFVVMPDHLHWLVQLGVHVTLQTLVGSSQGKIIVPHQPNPGAHGTGVAGGIPRSCPAR